MKKLLVLGHARVPIFYLVPIQFDQRKLLLRKKHPLESLDICLRCNFKYTFRDLKLIPLETNSFEKYPLQCRNEIQLEVSLTFISNQGLLGPFLPFLFLKNSISLNFLIQIEFKSAN